jgi:outer membrane protein assembly factor BamB
VAWAAKLPAGPGTGQDSTPPALSPVSVGGVAAFGYGNVVSARRLSDGRPVWQRAYPTAAKSAAGQIGGLWAWHGELIVLTAPVYLGERPVDMRVQALSPATGAVRWTANLGPGDLYNEQVVTSGGVLAVITETGGSGGRGKLMAVGLDAGRLLWSRPYGVQEGTDGPDAVGPVLVMASHGTVTGFDARTGAVRWSHSGMPGAVGSVAGPGDEVLLYDLLQQASPPQRPVPASRLFPVTALDAVTGRVLWRAKTAGPVSELSARGAVITVGTSGPYRLTLLNPAGHAVWSAPDYLPNPLSWVDTGTDLVYVSSEPDVNAPGVQPGLTRVTDRRLSTGAVRWSLRLGAYSSNQIVQPDGGNVLVTDQPGSGGAPAALALDAASGQIRGQAPLALTVNAPPTVAGGGALLEANAECAVPAASGAPAAGPGPAASTHP